MPPCCCTSCEFHVYTVSRSQTPGAVLWGRQLAGHLIKVCVWLGTTETAICVSALGNHLCLKLMGLAACHFRSCLRAGTEEEEKQANVELAQGVVVTLVCQVFSRHKTAKDPNRGSHERGDTYIGKHPVSLRNPEKGGDAAVEKEKKVVNPFRRLGEPIATRRGGAVALAELTTSA